MLKQANDLLIKTHAECLKHVEGNPYYENYANEKLHHSLQVFGLGKYIFKHEFSDKNEVFMDIALTAVLLHDIGRFKEIELWYDGAKGWLDHGRIGYEILKDMTEYQDFRILLTVKHHGHMIEEFYSDIDYQRIGDEKLKKEIEEIIFLVRDADKMANLFLFVNAPSVEESMLYKLDIVNMPKEQKTAPISENIFDDFMSGKVLLNDDIYSASDNILRYIAWLYDINFKSSMEFYIGHKLIDKYISYLRYYSQDENKLIAIEKKIKDYINRRYEQLKG